MTSGSPYSPTAAITVAQPTPNSAATAATVCPSSPTRRHASRRARCVQAARGRIASVVSVQVRRGHRGSRQRQIRLTQTSVTGRSAAGRSRTQLGRRSCNRARTPQPEHQPWPAVVSTACSSSPAYSDTASTTNPGNPRTAVAAIPSSRTWDLLRSMASDTSIVRSQVFFTAQAAHYGVARSPRLVEKSRITAGPPFLIGADPVSYTHLTLPTNREV